MPPGDECIWMNRKNDIYELDVYITQNIQRPKSNVKGKMYDISDLSSFSFSVDGPVAETGKKGKKKAPVCLPGLDSCGCSGILFACPRTADPLHILLCLLILRVDLEYLLVLLTGVCHQLPVPFIVTFDTQQYKCLCQ